MDEWNFLYHRNLETTDKKQIDQLREAAINLVS